MELERPGSLGATQDDTLSVNIACSKYEVGEGMEFCGKKYLASYKSRWIVPPDILFVAKAKGKVVGTGGLDLGSKHHHIGAEKYYHLTPRMEEFINASRNNLAEFGRFSSVRQDAAKAIFHATISYLEKHGVTYLFAWANPSIYTHLKDRLGIPFWVVQVPVNRQAVIEDTDWETPPVEFFFRRNPPNLLISIVPFWDLVNRNLGPSENSCGG